MTPPPPYVINCSLIDPGGNHFKNIIESLNTELIRHGSIRPIWTLCTPVLYVHHILHTQLSYTAIYFYSNRLVIRSRSLSDERSAETINLFATPSTEYLYLYRVLLYVCMYIFMVHGSTSTDQLLVREKMLIM